MQVLDKSRRDEAHRLRIEAIHKEDRGAQDCDEKLVAAERQFIDELVNFQARCRAHRKSRARFAASAAAARPCVGMLGVIWD